MMWFGLMTVFFGSVAALVPPTTPNAADSCPAVSPVASLDLAAYTSRTWYVQQQQPNGYQPLNQLFCVTATYDPDGGYTAPGFSGTVVGVFNYGNTGEVNGVATVSVGDPPLCARKADPADNGALIVAPCFLPNALAGDYWVVATSGLDSDGLYTWAVISGGQPDQEYPDGCTTTLEGVNGSGLWIFSSTPILPPSELADARRALVSLGFSTSELVDVQQDGCTYDGAYIKN